MSNPNSNINIKFEPTIKQDMMFKTFDNPIISEVLYGGSAGSAKSYGVCALIILKCLQYPGIRVGLARNSLTTLKKTTIISFFEVLTDWNLSDFVEYKSQSGLIVFFNGSVVVLSELNYLPRDPEYTRLGGLLLTFGVIDEVGEVDQKGYQIFKTRLNRWKNTENNIIGKLYMTCNPIKNWIKREFYDKYIDDRLEPHKLFIQALPTDNPYLAEEYLKSLDQLPESQRQRLKYGNWNYDDNPNALIQYEDINNLYSNDNEYINSSKEYYISADIAFTSDRLVIMVWKGYEIIEIYSKSGQEDKPEDLVKSFMKKYQVKHTNVIYDADGVGKYLKNYLPNSIAMINNGRPFNDENYQNLKTQLAFKLADVITMNKIRIRDNSNRDEIEEELGQLQNKPDNDVGKLKIVDKNYIKSQIGRSPDFLDAMIYRMYWEFKKSGLPTFVSF